MCVSSVEAEEAMATYPEPEVVVFSHCETLPEHPLNVSLAAVFAQIVELVATTVPGIIEA